MIESSKYVKPWREAVKYAAMEAGKHIPGPVVLVVTFHLKKPKSAKKDAVPSTRPDLSKLVRSTEDALKDSGMIEDDSRIVMTVSDKVYAEPQRPPGATIFIIRKKAQ